MTRSPADRRGTNTETNGSGRTRIRITPSRFPLVSQRYQRHEGPVYSGSAPRDVTYMLSACYGRLATSSISTWAFNGKPATATVVRAGNGAEKRVV